MRLIVTDVVYIGFEIIGCSLFYNILQKRIMSAEIWKMFEDAD